HGAKVALGSPLHEAFQVGAAFHGHVPVPVHELLHHGVASFPWICTVCGSVLPAGAPPFAGGSFGPSGSKGRTTPPATELFSGELRLVSGPMESFKTAKRWIGG